MIALRLLRIAIVGFVALFSIFGAFASFEPKADGSIHSGWLVFYLVLFVVTSLGVMWDLFGIFRAIRESSFEEDTETSS